MAGFFSNHSQSSRFLANSTASPASAVTTTPTTSTATSITRAPSSKHFSTSLSSSSKESLTPDVHPLRNTYRAPGNKIISYEEGIKKISAFSSVETFWSIWSHLAPPSSLTPTTDYLLFHSGVRRPVWEDPLNLSGGKWIIRLKKGVADRIWEDLVMAVVGDNFDECRSQNESEWPEICGCTISVRQSEDIISLWNRVDEDHKLREKIRDTLRRVLHLPPTTIMEYKSNNDSMQDKSSFRNSAIDRTSLS
ncbi:eukaryotic translation initiation factor 4E [Fistulina hepatica ATCC 64428]|uniref:Eukaryotic translation initiation factor 4E n=1 Tax=Fistulina hepatica ATCC 64428 TaxID=1128425 RepID=A0A0D6ZZ34_9AGAR|nr:eukaryotic translation initiation factor 4E [Fistulina hepatica ATCC 64428]